FPFDPNKADKAAFIKLGLSESQATNIINYRQAGGSFNIKKDFAKIYSIDAREYQRLEKYILLPASDTTRKAAMQEKPEIAKIEINSADTTALKQLPGIGPAFAGRIVKYRDLLGGFYDAAQLLEVYGMDTVRYAGFSQCVEVNPSDIRKMDLNSTGFKELLRHPYLEYYIVKSIFDYRDRLGRFDSVQQLLQVDLIYDQLYDKISNYVTVGNNETQ
ncbi:MAG: ComEA family DNA-binding protein, partial [Bacteroidota bacterium]